MFIVSAGLELLLWVFCFGCLGVAGDCVSLGWLFFELLGLVYDLSFAFWWFSGLALGYLRAGNGVC